MNLKVKVFLLLILSVTLLFGCEEKPHSYINIEGYITHSDTIEVTESRGKFVEIVKYIEIYVNGKNYRIHYTPSDESMLQVGNEIKIKITNESSLVIYEYEILEDNNSRMRDLLLKESKDLESVGE